MPPARIPVEELPSLEEQPGGIHVKMEACPGVYSSSGWKRAAALIEFRAVMRALTVTAALLFTCASAIAQEKKPEPQKLELADGGKTGLLPENTRTLAQKAAAAFTKRDWKTARAAYREMIEPEPENALAWANLGAVEQQAGDLSAAVTAFENSVKHNPELVQSWLALGMIHTSRGEFNLSVPL